MTWHFFETKRLSIKSLLGRSSRRHSDTMLVCIHLNGVIKTAAAETHRGLKKIPDGGKRVEKTKTESAQRIFLIEMK